MPEPEFLRATRTAYDTVAADYADLLRDELAERPVERALLAAFADLVRERDAPVADVGCGPGRVTAHLRDLGVDAFGIDLSPAMVAVARRDHPDLRFEVGSMTGLDVPDGALAGVVAWYSIIHVPDPELPGVLAGFARVLAPGGHVLVAFQVGDDVRHLDDAYGHRISLDTHQRRPERVAELLARAGLEVRARLVREPDPPEAAPRAVLLARGPAAGPPAGAGAPRAGVRPQRRSPERR